MTQEIKVKFDTLVGKTILYKDVVVKINTWKGFDSGTVIVIGDTKTFNLLPNEVQSFFLNLVFVDPTTQVEEKNKDKNQFPKPSPTKIIPMQETKTNEQVATTTTEAQIINPVQESVKIKTNLLEMMEKVKQDPKCLPQAKAMVEIANSIVGVQKNEIEIFKMFNKPQVKKS